MGWNHLSIPKLKWLHSWSVEMDKSFHCTLFWAYHYLSMLGLKLFHVSKMGPSEKTMPGYAFATLQWKFCHFEKILTIACIRCSHFDNCWCRWWWNFLSKWYNHFQLCSISFASHHNLTHRGTASKRYYKHTPLESLVYKLTGNHYMRPAVLMDIPWNL